MSLYASVKVSVNQTLPARCSYFHIFTGTVLLRTINPKITVSYFKLFLEIVPTWLANHTHTVYRWKECAVLALYSRYCSCHRCHGGDNLPHTLLFPKCCGTKECVADYRPHGNGGAAVENIFVKTSSCSLAYKQLSNTTQNNNKIHTIQNITYSSYQNRF